MVKVEQRYDARAMAMDADGEFTEISVQFIADGAADEAEALEAVRESAPEEWEDIPMESLEISSRDGDNVFTVEVKYKHKSSSTSSSKERNEEETTVSFDCGGGTMHLTHSHEQRIAYGTKKAGGAIGWNGKTGAEMSISGVDVPTAQLRETYTKVMRLSRITTSFKRKVAKLVGKVNSGSFKGWSKGEVMFLGMSYSCPAKKSTKVLVSFNFAVQPNESVNIAGHKVEKEFERYANHCVIWSGSFTETVTVDKACCSLDVMPTVLNLMGVEYDSRLYMGHDMLSEEPGFVQFRNGSIVTDYIRYSASTGKTEWLVDVDLSKEDKKSYVESCKSIAKTKLNIARAILSVDYYKYIQHLLPWIPISRN